MKKTPENRSDRLEEPEMIEILERIARNGGDTARIQAIKALRGLVDVAEDAPEDDWSEIYGNVTPIGRKQAG